MNNKPLSESNSLSGNAAQMKAIHHYEGPAMVLAGPGSGKTFVIVERLRFLIEEKKVDPGTILVITFTKAAAIEMQHRFMKITDSSYPEVCFGTFHSVFYQIIRQSIPNNKELKIATEVTKYKIVKDILLKLKANKIIEEDEASDALSLIREIVSEISKIKNIGISPADCADTVPLKKNFSRIFDEYNCSLKEYGFIDFDDMISECYELLKNNSQLLNSWADRFRFVMIDEYQDINAMQFNVINLITKRKNLFVVGDDDQSIYGFRGSDPGIMQNFPQIYKNDRPEIINLNLNYRCGRSILREALLLIKENKIRFDKDLKAADTNPLGYVVARRYINKNQQNNAIISFLNGHKEQLDKIAFIFRTNSEAYSMASSFNMAGIKTNLDNEAKCFADSPAVILCEQYLSFACLGKKREYFYKIMNKPMRYISRDCVDDEIVNETKIMNFYKGNASKEKEIQKLFRQINMISHMRPTLSVRFLRREVGIDKLFQNEIDALNDLSSLASEIPDNKLLLKKLAELREKKSDNSGGKKKKTVGNCVKLLTMHGSKGLEFDIVWLPNLNEGIIPSRSSVTPEQIEEERRMLYVAMTRAKTALIMSYLTGDENNPMLPSRFLRPIKHLWEKNQFSSSPSKPSSGSSTSSSNSTSSR